MSTISKNISLEEFKTRFPVCYPAIDDGGNVSYMSDLNTGTIIPDKKKACHYSMIPLGVNENIVPFGFTDEMEEIYSGTTLHCYTLQDWLDSFISYFNTLHSIDCRGAFSSMTEYSESVYGYVTEDAEEDDRIFLEHGGYGFYRWLTDNYFTMFDTWNEFDGTYEEIGEIVANIGCDRIPYPAAIELYGKMLTWQDSFQGVTACTQTDNCCDCEKYFSYGGERMVLALSEWVSRVEQAMVDIDGEISSDDVLMKNLVPQIRLDVPISGKVEDFGAFDVLAVPFEPKRVYVNGDVCLYDDDLWICECDSYQRNEFTPIEDDVELWKRYFEKYTEDGYEGDTPKISGRTVSALDSFFIPGQTSDSIGNPLPGNFTPDSNSYVVQPAEGTLLDFIYNPGAVSDETIVDSNGSITANKYSGNYLETITFFGKDTYGKVIDETVSSSSIVDGILMTPNEAIASTVEAIDSYSGFTDGKIYADFVYIKGSEYRYRLTNGKLVQVPCEPHMYVKCTDHCTVEERSYQYWLSYTDSYPVKYYKVNMDVEEYYSEERGTTTNVCMCDFETVGGSRRKVMENVNPPLFRKEETLWFSTKEKPKDNIYIDRGYATVLDRHLRIGEAFNYEQLAKYGNGMFQMFNSDEDVV